MTPSSTLVTFLLDRSGSMETIKRDTIGAFNAYLGTLKTSDVPITFSFLQFDTQSIDTVCKNVDVKSVVNLTDATFLPRGGTPLIDAAYKAIKAVEEAMSKRDDEPKIVICIQTDGEENSSREHNWEALNALIAQKTALGWQFNFMGAGIDAYKQASRMGISTAGTMSYDSSDTASTMAAFSGRAAATVMYASGASNCMGISWGEKMAAGDKFDPALKGSGKAPVSKRPQIDLTTLKSPHDIQL